MGIETGDIIRVVLDYNMLNTSAIQNAFHFVCSDGSAANEDVLDDWIDWATNVWHDAWKDFASAECLLTQVAVDKVDVAGHVLENFGAASLSLAGVGSGGTVSSEFSGLMYAATDAPKSRGMKYVPGADKDGTAENEIKSVLLGVLAQLAIAWLLDYVGVSSGARFVAGVASEAAMGFLPFTGSAVVSEIPANQRRRRRNRGA